jgi:hypothetical protein
MRQADIDTFVDSAGWSDTLTPREVTAAVAKGIPVNGLRSNWAATALYRAVRLGRREMVVALLAVGADPNAEIMRAIVWWAASDSTADILQLLINSGGSINGEKTEDDETPLIALVRHIHGDAAARLEMLLAQPELDLDVKYYGRTAERWAMHKRHAELAAAIATERRRRMRYGVLRSAWIAAIAFSS